MTPMDETLRIVRGEPDATEVAAATVALLAALRGGPAAEDAPRAPGTTWRADGSYHPPGAWSAPRGPQ